MRYIWWRARELNPRPLRCERSALPTELAPHPIFIDSGYELQALAGFAAHQHAEWAAKGERGGITLVPRVGILYTSPS